MDRRMNRKKHIELKNRRIERGTDIAFILTRPDARLLSEGGGHPCLEAGLPIQVSCHHITLTLKHYHYHHHYPHNYHHLGVAGAEDYSVTGNLLILNQVQDVSHLVVKILFVKF